MLQIRENLSIPMLVRAYEDAMFALEAAIGLDDQAAVAALDRKAAAAFEAILACSPRDRAEAGVLFDFLLEKLCQFEAGGELSDAIRRRLTALFNER